MFNENSGTNILIRNYQHPTDYQAALHVWKSAGKGIHITFSDSIDEIEKLVNKGPDLLFVAEIEGRIIGTVLGGFDGRRGLIYHLAVLPEYQKLHIGSQLLHTVEEALQKAGCTKVYLFVVPDNLDLADYYFKMDYEKMDVIPFTKYLGEKPASPK
jgi:ribosomal protein S18 acetylase RimI-like enzyme